MINRIIPLLNPPPWGRTLLLLSFSKIYNSGWGIFSIIVSLFSICVFIIVLFHFFCFILILFGTIMEINLGRQNSYFLSSKSLEKNKQKLRFFQRKILRTLLTGRSNSGRFKQPAASSRLFFTNFLQQKSGRRDSNSRQPAWKAGTLPLSYFRLTIYSIVNRDNGSAPSTCSPCPATSRHR